VIGYSEMLAEEAEERGLTEFVEDLARIRAASNHLLGLINDVLDLTKIGAGRLEIRLDVVPIEPVVERAVSQVAPLAESKGLEVVVAGNGQTRALADEKRLSQILINLTSNAVKFTEDGGIELRFGVEDDRVKILVEDTGPGIPEEELDRVFEEFHQVEGGHARSASGTGLGLAISRRLARLMGGDLTVHSEVGTGSVFAIDLPAAGAAEASPSGVDARYRPNQ
jgi:signal transduction histidine kinase